MAISREHVTLRDARQEDEPFFARLHAEVRGPEIATFGWPPPMAESLLAQQHAVRDRGYRAQHPRSIPKVILVGGEPVGRLWVARTADALVLVDVALIAACRGRGIGSALLNDLKTEAQAVNLPLRLSVAAGNPAQRLYAKAGFQVTATDPMYAQMEWRP